MELKQGIFAVKLCELEKEYGLLQSTISLCQGKNPHEIHRKLEQVQEACRLQEQLLDLSVRSCSLPAVSALAKAQLDYGKKAKTLFFTELQKDMEGKNQTPAQDRAEAAALYAEYAIDFATLAMRYALSCALSSMELEYAAEEKGAIRKKEESDL